MKRLAAFTTMLFAFVSLSTRVAHGQSSPPASRNGEVVAQEKDEPRMLEMSELVMISGESGGAMMFPFRCDKDDNVYLRMLNVDAPFSGPIKKFDKHGKLAATFRLTDPDSLGISDYSVRPSGDLFALGGESHGRKQFIFRFGKNGELKDKIELERSFRGLLLGAISDDKFVIAGHKIPNRADPSESHPFTALVDNRGAVIARIGGADVEDDAKVEPPEPEADAQGTAATTAGRKKLVIAGGSIVVGDDSAFLLRRSSPATIYQISASGEIVKTLHVGRKGETPYLMQYNDGKLLVGLKMKDKNLVVYRSIDVNSGDEIASYQVGPKLGVSLSCYTDEALSFLGTQEGHLVLRRASLR